MEMKAQRLKSLMIIIGVILALLLLLTQETLSARIQIVQLIQI